jgi:hypothetical protein
MQRKNYMLRSEACFNTISMILKLSPHFEAQRVKSEKGSGPTKPTERLLLEEDFLTRLSLLVVLTRTRIRCEYAGVGSKRSMLVYAAGKATMSSNGLFDSGWHRVLFTESILPIPSAHSEQHNIFWLQW